MLKLNAEPMSLTLVAFFGDKPPALTRLFDTAIRLLLDELGNGFKPYTLEQIHATLIGLEGFRLDRQLMNRNLMAVNQQPGAMDLKAALQLLCDPSLMPFELTLGGYQSAVHYPFVSRGQTPYQRSLSVHGDSVVTMAWPYTEGEYSLALDRLRRSFNPVNILHKYHDLAASVDNDLFFVLGRINVRAIERERLSRAQQRLRDFFAGNEPVKVELNRDRLKIIAYQDASLPSSTSRVFSLDEAEQQLATIETFFTPWCN